MIRETNQEILETLLYSPQQLFAHIA